MSLLIQGHHLTALHVTDLMETGYSNQCKVAPSDLGSKGRKYVNIFWHLLFFILERKISDLSQAHVHVYTTDMQNVSPWLGEESVPY